MNQISNHRISIVNIRHYHDCPHFTINKVPDEDARLYQFSILILIVKWNIWWQTYFLMIRFATCFKCWVCWWSYHDTAGHSHDGSKDVWGMSDPISFVYQIIWENSSPLTHRTATNTKWWWTMSNEYDGNQDAFYREDYGEMKLSIKSWQILKNNTAYRDYIVIREGLRLNGWAFILLWREWQQD